MNTGAILKTLHRHFIVAVLGFPTEGRQTLGAANLLFEHFLSKNLQENEEILTQKVGRTSLAHSSPDPPMVKNYHIAQYK